MVKWITIPADRTTYVLSEVDEIKKVADVLCATVESEFVQRNFNTEGVCYATLASPSYDWGLRVLLRSLRRVSKIPVIVFATQRWTFEWDEPDVLALEVPRLVNPQYEPLRSGFEEVLTKLWAFALIRFRRVTFVDADCLFLRSIDDLFDMTGFVAAPDFAMSATYKGFNSGLFSFDPKQPLRDFIYERAYDTPSPEGGDQGLLNELMRFQVRLLPPEYNVLRPYHHYAGIELKRSETRMIHYTMKKPWEVWAGGEIDDLLANLDDLWTEVLTRDELLELIGLWRRTTYPLLVERKLKARQVWRRRQRVVTLAAALFTGLLLFGLGYIAATTLHR